MRSLWLNIIENYFVEAKKDYWLKCFNIRPVRKQSITVLLHVLTLLQGTESQQDQNHHLEENQAIADALEIL